ncbi:MAG: signal peptide peptidase SppA [Gammaproteobacteria bacterium]|nr:signal peptide peptidase SppA [Gammaproteobacteria bacterium]
MSLLFRMFKGVLRGIDIALRVTVNLVFLFLLIAVLGVAFSDKGPRVPQGAALVVAPEGILVEEYTGDPVDRAVNKFFGEEVPEVRVADILDAINSAKDDARIKALVIKPDNLLGGGLSKLEEIAAAITRFKESGKPVIAIGGGFGQNQYLLAAPADEIYMHPMGFAYVTGYSFYRMFYKEGLDKLGVQWNVFRAGEYKSFGEPYTRNDMSPEAREANSVLLDALWQRYQHSVTAARGLEEDVIGDYADNLLSSLQASDGDFSMLALEAGLVDGLMGRDQMRARVIEIVGTDRRNPDTFKQIGMHAYLQNVRQASAMPTGDGIGVVVASGSILDGRQPPGTVGGDSTAQLIRRAVADDSVKAILFRVDSPGGSSYASDLILRELEVAQRVGKPVVVSMSSVAASGGYWISMSADEIWANPSSVTGSIGVVGMFPTFEDTLGKIGISVDGVTTAPFAGALRLDRSMSEDVKRVFQLSVDSQYRNFINKVSEARGLPVEEVDKIARGRVWSGEDAHRLGLIDHMGGFEDALASAASLADIGDDYIVKFIERELDLSEQLLISFFNSAASFKPLQNITSRWRASHNTLVRQISVELQRLAGFNDPNGIYYYCFCETL